jgi:hypothetical protein
MKILAKFSGTIFSLLFFYSVAFSQNGQLAPKTVVQDADFNFGEVAEGTRVEHIFKVSNSGTAPLELQRIQPACGCTAAIVDPKIVAPGAEGQVKATLDTTGFHGAKEKTIRVFTNDPVNSSFLLTLRGTIKELFVLESPRFYLNEVRKGVSAKLQNRISIQDPSLKIVDISLKAEHLELSQEGEIDKVITLTVMPSAPVGVIQGNVLVHTSSEKQPVITIPIYLKIIGDLVPSPGEVSFGLLQGPLEAPVPKEILLRNLSSQLLSIEKIEVEGNAVKAEAEGIVGARDFKLRVSIEPGSIGVLRSRVKIFTNHSDPDQKVLMVPVYAMINRRSD